MSEDHLASLHHKFYQEPGVTAFYDGKRDLYAPEKTIFDLVETHLRNCRFLDLGIGAGRTTGHVLKLTENYIGIDYVPEMVEAAKRRFPGVDLRTADARRIDVFEDASFDAIMFSFNGLDTLTEEDRLKILREVSRLLKPGGLFIFSAHNRSKPVTKPWHLAEFQASKNPVRVAKNFLYYVRGILNYFAQASGQWETADKACWLDTGTNFLAPLYFITKEAQMKQLAQTGLAYPHAQDSGPLPPRDGEGRGKPVQNDH